MVWLRWNSWTGYHRTMKKLIMHCLKILPQLLVIKHPLIRLKTICFFLRSGLEVSSIGFCLQKRQQGHFYPDTETVALIYIYSLILHNCLHAKILTGLPSSQLHLLFKIFLSQSKLLSSSLDWAIGSFFLQGTLVNTWLLAINVLYLSRIEPKMSLLKRSFMIAVLF